MKLCHVTDLIQSLWNFLAEQFVLKLCQIDNLCHEEFQTFVLKINCTFSGGQKLLFSEGHETFSNHSFETRNNFSETLSE